LYDLHNSTEWKNGAAKLLEPHPQKPADAVRDYLELINEEGFSTNQRYPGSPLIMKKLLRRQDRLVCFELHPKDFISLESVMKPGCEVRNEDGPLSLMSLLPPESGRGLIFTDPSWEKKDEYTAIPEQIKKALKRFPAGTYIIWYPLLDKPKTVIQNIGDVFFGIYRGNRCRFELYNPKAAVTVHSPRGMSGSGIVIYNPPWTLKPVLQEMLPFLANVLMDRGDWNLQWNAE